MKRVLRSSTKNRREINPSINSTVKVEQVEFHNLSSDPDFGISIKEEESNLKIDSYDDTTINSQHYCPPCNKKYASDKAFRTHLNDLHKTNLTSLKDRENLKAAKDSIEPDPNDPNFYCKSCKNKYARLKIYQQHLRRTHKMKLKPLVVRPNPNPNIEPDINDPNAYCRSCNVKYSKIGGSYLNHLRTVHKMNIPRLKSRSKPNHNTQPDVNNPNFYCRSCHSEYKDYHKYTVYLRKVHKTILPLRSRAMPNHNIKPDLNDPNFYYRSYNINYKSRKQFRIHLYGVHKMKIIPLARKLKIDCDGIEPELSNQNYHYRQSHRGIQPKSQ